MATSVAEPWKGHRFGSSLATFRCRIFLSVLTASSFAIAENVDKRLGNECACWAAQGNCKTNPKFMLGECAASCDKQAGFEASAARISDLVDQLSTQTRIAEASATDASKAEAKIAALEEEVRTQRQAAQASESVAGKAANRIAELEEQVRVQTQEVERAKEASGGEASKASTRIAELEEQVRAQTQDAEQASLKAQQESSSKQARIAELEEEATRHAAALKEAQASAGEANNAAARISELEEQVRAQTQDAEQARLKAQQESSSKQARIAELEEEATRHAAAFKEAQASAGEANNAAARITELEEQVRAQTEDVEQASLKAQQESSSKQARIAELEQEVSRHAAALKEAQASADDANNAAARIADLEEQLRQTQDAEQASSKVQHESATISHTVDLKEKVPRQAHAELQEAEVSGTGTHWSFPFSSLKFLEVSGFSELSDWFSVHSQVVVEKIMTVITQLQEILGNDTVDFIKDKAGLLNDWTLVALEHANYSYRALMEQAEPALNTLEESARPYADVFLYGAPVYIEAISFAFFSASYPGSFAILFWILIVVVAVTWYLLCFLLQCCCCRGRRCWRRGCCCVCLPCCLCLKLCRLVHPCSRKARKADQPTGDSGASIAGSAQSFFIGDDDDLMPSLSGTMESPPSLRNAATCKLESLDVKSPTIPASTSEAISMNLLDLSTSNYPSVTPTDDLSTDALEPPTGSAAANIVSVPPQEMTVAGPRDSGEAPSAPPRGYVSALVSKAEARAKSGSSPTGAMAPVRKVGVGEQMPDGDASAVSRLEDILKRIEAKIDTLVRSADSQPDLASIVTEAVKSVTPARQVVNQSQNIRQDLSLSV